MTTSASFDTTPSPFSNKEPAGVAYLSGSLSQRRVFVSNDGKAYVQEVSADSQGRFYRTGSLVHQWSTLATGSALQSQDSEGLGFGVVSGTPTLFIADGKDKEIWTVKPGNNGIFEGRGDDVITHFDTLSLGQDNPEDVAFDPRDNTLWIVSNKTGTSILHTTLGGTPIETINVTNNPFVAPGGITIAPASSGVGSNVYVADRGIDNNPQPTENDGKIYEIAVAGGGGNTPPTANPVSDTTPQGTSKTITLSGSDAETCQLTFSIVSLPTHGSVGSITNNACVAGAPNTDSASVLYTPDTGYNGPDSFTYKVNDGTGDSSPATVTITVTSTGNAPPTANPVTDSTPQDTPQTVTLSGNDAETCELVFSIVTQPTHGSVPTTPTDLPCSGTGPYGDTATVLYTPTAGYTGPDSFTYTVNDGTTTSAPATVTMTVTSIGGGIALRSTASGANTGASTLVLPLPAGTAAGDVLLAAVTVRGTPTISASGWTQVRRDSRTTTFTQAVFYHVAGASEPASYTFTFNSSQTAVGTIVAYSGVDTASPIAAQNGRVTSSSATITAPSVTTAVPNTQLVAFFGIVGKTTIGTSSGMTEQTEVVSPKAAAAKLTASLDDQPMAAAGASGDRTATAGVAAHNIGQLVALRPA